MSKSEPPTPPPQQAGIVTFQDRVAKGLAVDMSNVWVPEERQRKTYTKEGIDSLAISLQTKGQLQNIVVIREPDGKGHEWRLIAGFRRMLAARQLGWTYLRAIEKPNASPLVIEEIELDENLQRENLSWQEEVVAKKRIWEIRAELYGETVEQAAQHVGMSRGSLWEDARLAKVMEEVPELRNAKNKTQAMNKLRLLTRRMALEELATRGGQQDELSKSYEQKVILGNCIEVMQKMASGIIHCVVTDPPYGIDLDEAQAKKGNLHPEVYHDDHYDIMEVVSLAAREAYRVLVKDSHAYFWFDIKAYSTVFKILTDVGFVVEPIPLIWAKNVPGQTNHPESRWASGYETCFFCRKGNRALLKQGATNVLHYDTVPGGKKIHPTEKPSALLRQLIEASTVAGEIVLDMFGGSGSTAEAAIQTGRNFLTIERDPAYHAGIINRLGKLQKQSAVLESSESGGDLDLGDAEGEDVESEDDESDIDEAYNRHLR